MNIEYNLYLYNEICLSRLIPPFEYSTLSQKKDVRKISILRNFRFFDF